VIEEVINASLYKVTLLLENRQVFLVLDGIVGWGTENQYDFIEDESKYVLPYKFIESRRHAEFVALNREMGIKISGLDSKGNLVGIL